MTKLHYIQALTGVALLAIAAGFWDWRAGLAVAGIMLYVDYALERRESYRYITGAKQ